ncbi:hypothetical protein M2475_001699 [Breznakia sp. PF5-3]|uniref:hypothetical protein n=1 Tax=unclassified Breznakia TaxID=2623764 RepID=UPI0024052730|nr:MULTISPECIES: hypothetical protein [unclassified Breznakia]MDF9825235.1 hypothetical protein [Breznakia sp. PM6-1]MDF9836123.1 hypothetical protein [Breznakia sp. PF5-3]MDF9838388.1 hypothetical protein [Breznakia sp. PFB2-8]MDF9860404.1 hypothetical protein [Breznakia sp. PH5-24]
MKKIKEIMTFIQNSDKSKKRLKIVLVTLSVVIVLVATISIFEMSNSKDSVVATSYIENIVYKKEKTNTDVQVAIMISGDADESKLSVTSNKKKIAVKKEDDVLHFIVQKNGNYKISYGKFSETIKIDNIDKDGPVLKSINKDSSGLLTLTVTDKGSGIDYKKSHIKVDDEKITIMKSKQDIAVIKEALEKDATLMLYDKAGNYASYDIRVEDIE